jgi:hypothetical protein
MTSTVVTSLAPERDQPRRGPWAIEVSSLIA